MTISREELQRLHEAATKGLPSMEAERDLFRYLRNAVPDILKLISERDALEKRCERLEEVLDRLLAFHDHTHAKHDLLHDEYYEACIANEVPPSGSGLLDQLKYDARAALEEPKA